MAVQAETLEMLERMNMSPQMVRAIAQGIDIELSARSNDFALKSDLTQLRHSLELRMEALRSDILRHMYTAILTQMALLVGIGYFLVNYALR